MPVEDVNRVYQCLFVYTVGFFELLQDSTRYLKENNYTYQMRIWKVYMILLEYACKTDYQLITTQSKFPSLMNVNYSGEGKSRAGRGDGEEVSNRDRPTGVERGFAQV